MSCHLTAGEEPSVPIYWVGGPKAVIDGEDFLPSAQYKFTPHSSVVQTFRLITIQTKLPRSCFCQWHRLKSDS